MGINTTVRSGRIFDGPSLLLLLCLLSGTSSAHYYASCFQSLADADHNEDVQISAEEYVSFLTSFTAGAVSSVPSDALLLIQPSKKSTRDIGDEFIPIAGAIPNAHEAVQAIPRQLCQNLVESLLSYFGVKVGYRTCMEAMQTADIEPSNGKLSRDSEYLSFLTALTGKSFDSVPGFGNLPPLLQSAFNDMAIDHEIGSDDQEYLTEFCQRAALAEALDAASSVSNSKPLTTNRPSEQRELLASTEVAFEATVLISTDPLVIANGRKTREGTLGPMGARSLDDRIQSMTQAPYDEEPAVERHNQAKTAAPSLLPAQGEAKENVITQCVDAISPKDASTLLGNYMNKSSSSRNIGEVSKLDDQFYRACKMAMYIVDVDRDDLMSNEEYARFVQRLTYGTVNVAAYEDLDPAIKAVHDKVVNSNGFLEIAGSKPGIDPTEDQDTMLQSICSAMDQIVPRQETAVSITIDDTVPLSLTNQTSGENDSGHTQSNETLARAVGNNESQPDDGTGTMSSTKFKRCKTEMMKADVNNDGFLDRNEFFVLLSALRRASVDELAPTFIASFVDLSMKTAYIDIQGVSLLSTPVQEGDEKLKFLCYEMYDTIDRFKNPVSPDQECIYSMHIADSNSDDLLDEMEYVDFLNSWSDMKYKDLSFTGIPFFLQASFYWSKLGEFVDIRGSSLKETQLNDLKHLEWICERSKSVVATDHHAVTLVDYCRASMIAADADRDNFLDESEFVSLIDIFTDTLWADLTFESMDPLLKDFFNKTQDLANGSLRAERVGMVNTTSGQDLTDFCAGFEEAVRKANEAIMFPQLCKIALENSDTTRDGRLSKDEYAPFVYRIAFSSLSEKQLQKVIFAELGKTIQSHFETLAGTEGEIDMPGLYEPTHSPEQEELFQKICNSVGEKAITEIQSNTTVVVYNSFIISNQKKMTGAQLSTGHERKVLVEAYTEFSQEQASTAPDERRKLTIVGAVPGSGQIYLIEDSSCPSGTSGTACQTAFGSFHLIVLNEAGPEALSAFISDRIQSAIDSGALQAILSRIDPNVQLKVERSSLPLVPAEPSISPTSAPLIYDADSSLLVKTGTLAVISLTGVFSIGLMLFGCYYGRRVQRKCKEYAVNSQMTESEVDGGDDDDEDEDEAGLSVKEKERRKRERELRQSFVPLLLTQAYHLPGYTYGEDLFQYIYNSHPVFGIFWHHPLHPLGFKIRIISLIGSCAFGLAMTNTIFLVFMLTGQDFNKSYAEHLSEFTRTGKNGFDTEIASAAANISNGNIVVWTIGSTLHAFYDCSLWSVAACTCFMKGGFVQKLERYQRVGSLAVTLMVAGVVAIAMITAGLRISLIDEDTSLEELKAKGLGEDQLNVFNKMNSATDLAFVEAYGVEVLTTFFFYYPLFGWVLFSGMFGCCGKNMFGGRPYEVMLEDREKQRKLRVQKRKALIKSIMLREEKGDNSSISDSSLPSGSIRSNSRDVIKGMDKVIPSSSSSLLVESQQRSMDIAITRACSSPPLQASTEDSSPSQEPGTPARGVTRSLTVGTLSTNDAKLQQQERLRGIGPSSQSCRVLGAEGPVNQRSNSSTHLPYYNGSFHGVGPRHHSAMGMQGGRRIATAPKKSHSMRDDVMANHSENQYGYNPNFPSTVLRQPLPFQQQWEMQRAAPFRPVHPTGLSRSISYNNYGVPSRQPMQSTFSSRSLQGGPPMTRAHMTRAPGVNSMAYNNYGTPSGQPMNSTFSSRSLQGGRPMTTAPYANSMSYNIYGTPSRQPMNSTLSSRSLQEGQRINCGASIAPPIVRTPSSGLLKEGPPTMIMLTDTNTLPDINIGASGPQPITRPRSSCSLKSLHLDSIAEMAPNSNRPIPRTNSDRSLT